MRIREPLGSQQLESRTERWLVIVPNAVSPVGAVSPGGARGPPCPVDQHRGRKREKTTLLKGLFLSVQVPVPKAKPAVAAPKDGNNRRVGGPLSRGVPHLGCHRSWGVPAPGMSPVWGCPQSWGAPYPRGVPSPGGIPYSRGVSYSGGVPNPGVPPGPPLLSLPAQMVS